MTDTKRLKAALYVRVSTDEQAEKGSSLATQEENLRDYCTRQEIEIGAVYRDDGYTGSNIDRPGLQQLLADARKGQFNMVLAYKLDRLSRDLKDAVNLVLGSLGESGIAFRSITEAFDSSRPEGKVMFASFASFADYERAQIRERCIRGRIRKNKEGRFTGGNLPYAIGWNKAAAKYELVEAEAKVYRMVFDLYLEKRLSFGEIADQLTQLGIRTRKDVRFGSRGVQFLLGSHSAYGEWHRHRMVDTKKKAPERQRKFNEPLARVREQRPADQWITQQVPAVVSKERWEQAQEIIRSRSLGPRRKRPATLCQGFLFCGECGTRVGTVWTCAKKGGRPHYTCYCRRYAGQPDRYPSYAGRTCDLPNFEVDVIDGAVWNQIEAMILDPGLLWEAVYGNQQGGDRSETESRVAELKRELAKAKGQEERAAQLLVMEDVDQKMAREKVQEVASRRRRVEADLAQAQRMLASTQNLQEAKERAFAVLTAMRHKIDRLTLEQKRRILRVLVPGGPEYRITLQKGGRVIIDGTVDIAAGSRYGSQYSTPTYVS